MRSLIILVVRLCQLGSSTILGRIGPWLYLVTAPDQVHGGSEDVDPGTDPEHRPPLGHVRVVRQQRPHHRGGHEPWDVAECVGQGEC